jgi:formylglycine-generating enzyme required for sulfatase activity/serine/threonine protein kinase
MDAAPSLHPTDQTLSSYGLGKLDDRSAEAVNEHLMECSACRKRVAEMSADSFLKRVRDAQKPAGNATSSQPQAAGTPSSQGTNALPSSSGDSLPPELATHPDYEIKRELGRGGMGVVYLAHNRLMGRDEVLKVIGQHLVDYPGALERFLREIRAVARLRHANIVTAYHATRVGQSILLAMEYVAGDDLSKLVQAKGPLPVAHACYFIHQAALGLQHAHEEGLVHRDIKPGNLILLRKGNTATVKILDFGLAKAAREEKVEDQLTFAGQALGTPAYMAPEQITDAQTADIRADIYSLGGTLYFLLAGRPPFQAKTQYELFQAHISRIADPLNQVRSDVSAELAALVAKMLAKDPADRFQTPAEVAQALKPFCTKANAAGEIPKTEVACTEPAQTVRPVAEAFSAETQLETDADRRSVRPGKTAGSSVAESHWEDRIDFKETEREMEAAPDVAPRQWRPRVLASVAVGVLTLGFVAAWIVLKIWTTDGVIVLENVPSDSEIFVDGEKITLSWPGVGKPFEIRKAPGQHKLEVKKDGFKTFGEVVTVKSGESEEVTVRLERSGPGESASVDPVVPKMMTNSIGMKLVLIPAGEFLMGSPDSDDEAYSQEKPQHPVRITRPFYMGVHEVTEGQYRAVVGGTPSDFEGTDNLPVVKVSWLDAIAYCNKLSEREGLKPFYQFGAEVKTGTEGYRLPTEAEWEYACRAGSTARYSSGDSWDHGNAGRMIHPVGQREPNAWGLYDMHGNVREWCWDWYDPGYYAQSQAADPLGPRQATDRVNRGGSWDVHPRYCRSAYREGLSPAYRSTYVGLRVARSQSGR